MTAAQLRSQVSRKGSPMVYEGGFSSRWEELSYENLPPLCRHEVGALLVKVA
jgi:hypothetical protein